MLSMPSPFLSLVYLSEGEACIFFVIQEWVTAPHEGLSLPLSPVQVLEHLARSCWYSLLCSWAEDALAH